MCICLAKSMQIQRETLDVRKAMLPISLLPCMLIHKYSGIGLQ